MPRLPLIKLCRVFHRPDGTIAILRPSQKIKPDNETDQQFLERIVAKDTKGTELENLDFEDKLASELPDRAKRNKWRWKAGQGIYIDESVITRNETRASIRAKIDAELNKSQPDAGKIFKWKRVLDTMPFG